MSEKVVRLSQQIAKEPITDEDREEYYTCLTNPFYFLENYYYIPVAGEGRKVIKLRPGQREGLELFWKNHFTYVLKSRQVGFTTAALGYALWATLFWQLKVIIVEPKLELAKKKIKEVLLPALSDWIEHPEKRRLFKFFPLQHASSEHIVTEKGAFIYPSSPRSGVRSSTVDLVILDEYQSLPDAESFMAELYPILQTNFDRYVRVLKKLREEGSDNLTVSDRKVLIRPWGLLIIGTGGVIGHPRYPNAEMASRHWEEAKKEVEFLEGTGIRLVPFEYHWSEVFSSEMMEAQIRLQSEQQKIPIQFVRAEQELVFVHAADIEKGDSAGLISPFSVRKARDHVNSIEFELFDINIDDEELPVTGTLKLFTKFPDDFYTVFGLDISTGAGDDYTAIQVLDPFSYTQLAEVKVKGFPYTIVKLVKELNDNFFPLSKVVRIAVEQHRAEEFLVRLSSYLESEGINPRSVIMGEKSTYKNTEWLPGIRLQRAGKKAEIAQAIRFALSYSPNIIMSKELFEQILRIDPSTLHAKGSNEHDDLFSAWAMAIYAIHTMGSSRLEYKPSSVRALRWLENNLSLTSSEVSSLIDTPKVLDGVEILLSRGYISNKDITQRKVKIPHRADDFVSKFVDSLIDTIYKGRS